MRVGERKLRRGKRGRGTGWRARAKKVGEEERWGKGRGRWTMKKKRREEEDRSRREGGGREVVGGRGEGGK